jgi:hypothetical protein
MRRGNNRLEPDALAWIEVEDDPVGSIRPVDHGAPGMDLEHPHLRQRH